MYLLTIFGLCMAIVANMSGIEGGMIFVPLFILLVPGVLAGSQRGAWLAAKRPAPLRLKLPGGLVVLTGPVVLARGLGLGS
jgi:uncharacterized membrane protein YfcA